MAFSSLSEFWFFCYRLILGARFARLSDSFDVMFLNPRLDTSNDMFDECAVLSYIVKRLFSIQHPTLFLQKI